MTTPPIPITIVIDKPSSKVSTIPQSPTNPQSPISRKSTFKHQPSVNDFKIAITNPHQETFRWGDVPNPREYERPEIRMYYQFMARSNQWICPMFFVLVFLMAIWIGLIVANSQGQKQNNNMTIAIVGISCAIAMWIVSIIFVRYMTLSHYEFLLTFVETSVQAASDKGRNSFSSHSSQE